MYSPQGKLYFSELALSSCQIWALFVTVKISSETLEETNVRLGSFSQEKILKAFWSLKQDQFLKMWSMLLHTFLVVIIWNSCICIHKANKEHTLLRNSARWLKFASSRGKKWLLNCSKESQPINTESLASALNGGLMCYVTACILKL